MRPYLTRLGKVSGRFSEASSPVATQGDVTEDATPIIKAKRRSLVNSPRN